MNNTQFLCYGLLKIFLKEAINSNKDVDGLLFSYYLKTAVFWEIIDNTEQWIPDLFLRCFWRCLIRLIQWVNDEFCPNFFIPENNIMMGKFNRLSKSALLHHLLTLHNEGYMCLLRCQSLHDVLSNIIQEPIIVTLLPTEEELVTKVRTDLETVRHMRDPVSNIDLKSIMKNMEYIDLLQERSTNDLQLSVLYAWKSYFLCTLYLSFISKHTEEQTANNKTLKSSLENILNAIQQCCFDPVYTHSVIAIGMYKLGRYKHVV